MQPKDDGSLLQKRQELQREVEANKRQLSMQVSKIRILGELKLILSNIALSKTVTKTKTSTLRN